MKRFVQTEDRTAADGQAEVLVFWISLPKEDRTQAIPAGGVIVGKFAGFDDTGNPLVDFVADVSHEGIVARTIIALGKNQVGFDVVLAFEHGDLEKPIITGMLWQPESSLAQQAPEAQLDGERVVLTAKKEIVLRCGKASITLTRAGKVIIRGAYLLSRSSGVNSIKGGSVQIN